MRRCRVRKEATYGRGEGFFFSTSTVAAAAARGKGRYCDLALLSDYSGYLYLS